LKNKRNLSDSNRRKWPRLKPEAIPFLKSINFSQGSEVRVIDISRGGVLLETEVRLRPQMKLLLKLITTEGIVKMEGHVLRSSITSLTGVPKYRSAISFEHPFHMLDDLSAALEEQARDIPSEAAAPAMPDTSGDQPLMDPDSGCRSLNGEESAILTVIAQDGVSLQEMFKLNDW
jgi:hypothetical protein